MLDLRLQAFASSAEYSGFVEQDHILRVVGELEVERVSRPSGGDQGDEEQDQFKVFIARIEDLETYQGQSFPGAVIKLPTGECPGRPLQAALRPQGLAACLYRFRSHNDLAAWVKTGLGWVLSTTPLWRTRWL